MELAKKCLLASIKNQKLNIIRNFSVSSAQLKVICRFFWKYNNFLNNFKYIFKGRKVAVLGAAGGIGQPLSLLLKHSPLVNELSLYDINHTKGVGADLSHIDTKCKVSAFVGKEQLHDSLVGCDIVVIPAGVPRKPGNTKQQLILDIY